jgi:DNA-binding CsgD family transcriptional regulator
MPRTNLTARERQILELIGGGRSTKEIACALGISVWTVASHRKRICGKLGVHTTAELVALSSAESRASTFEAGRRAERCYLAVDLGTRTGHLRLTYSGRLKRTPAVATVRIGRNLFYF